MFEGLDAALAQRLERISREMTTWRAKGIEIVACGIGAGDVIVIHLRKLHPLWIDQLVAEYGPDLRFEESDYPRTVGISK